jgi:hypothetical protein
MRLDTRAGAHAVAALAATLFLSAPLAAAPAEKVTGHCVGANACKGQSSCKSAHNTCKGQNACKGQGFVELTKEQCDQVSGSFEPPEKKP